LRGLWLSDRLPVAWRAFKRRRFRVVSAAA
jgi:hypothetical protein